MHTKRQTLTDTHTERSHRCRGHPSNHCMVWLVFIHCINCAEASEMLCTAQAAQPRLETDILAIAQLLFHFLASATHRKRQQARWIVKYQLCGCLSLALRPLDAWSKFLLDHVSAGVWEAARAWRFCLSTRILSISPVWSARSTVAKIAISSSRSVWQLCVSCRLQCPVSGSIFVRQFLQAAYIGLPKRLLHTDVLHKEASTHRSFNMQTLLHIDAFKHRRFYRQTLLHKHLHTQRLLHTDAFTRRHFYTQTLLHTDTFTQTHSHAKTVTHTHAFRHRHIHTILHTRLLHTEAFTCRPFYT